MSNIVTGPIFTPQSIVSDEPGGNQGTLTLPDSWGFANRNTGDHIWQIANGDSLSEHPDLHELDLPTLGIASRPAALLTRTLLFIGVGSNNHGGTQPNMWGTAFRAYDKFTGEEAWRTDLPLSTTGAPMSYMQEGRQFIVVAVGSFGDEPELVALGLPYR